MTAIEVIVQTIEEVTNLKTAVKGGNIRGPLEYFYSRTGLYSFRLELCINGNDLLQVQSITDTIIRSINDFGDNSRLPGASVDIAGGGTLTDGSDITQVLYFDVIDNGMGVEPPVPRPSGTLDITENGIYDVGTYANARVQTSGSMPWYEGTYSVEPRKVSQVLETSNKAMADDVTVLKIYEQSVSNVDGTTLYIGKE